jgi:hypothetical protein
MSHLSNCCNIEYIIMWGDRHTMMNFVLVNLKWSCCWWKNTMKIFGWVICQTVVTLIFMWGDSQRMIFFLVNLEWSFCWWKNAMIIFWWVVCQTVLPLILCELIFWWVICQTVVDVAIVALFVGLWGYCWIVRRYILLKILKYWIYRLYGL